jgi:hypothetical protein
MRIWGRYVLVAAGIIVAVYIALAALFRLEPVTEVAPLLEYEVLAASRIARIKLDARAPVRPHDCGYIYRGTVIEALKGGTEQYVFYASAESLRVGSEYLVFLHKIQSSAYRSFDRVSDLLDVSARDTLACRLYAEDYFLPVPRKTYFEFDLEAADKFGGEWLSDHDPDREFGFMWCYSWPVDTEAPKRNVLVTRQKEEGSLNLQTLVISWESAKKVIQEAQRNPPFWFGVIPNPVFRPAAC